MSLLSGVKVFAPLSLVQGAPLAEEPGIGSLTIPGYLREVVARYGDREAVAYLAMKGPGANKIVRWSYTDLWRRAQELARAFIAAGVGRDSRVGILMTNRPEFIAAVFGVALAGGVSVPISTFSTPVELEHLVRFSGISLLLFERDIAGRDYSGVLRDLEPGIEAAAPGNLYSARFPLLRRLVMLDDGPDAGQVAGAIECWQQFLTGSERVPATQVAAIAATVEPSDLSTIFFSSGTTGLPKGMVHTQRAVTLQWWRWPRVYALGDDVRTWTANGFFWSGLFSSVIGSSFSTGGAIILQSTFDPERALELMASERVTLPIAKRHQWARMETAPNFLQVDLGALRYLDETKYLQVKHPAIKTDWHDPRAYGATETFTNSTTIPSSMDYDASSRNFGPPLPGNIFKIVDPASGDIVPLGESGEIALKGPTLMVGYLGKTDEESFDQDGFFRTGDGGHIDESGQVFWEGRLNDIIKTGGANVSPNEIDLAVLRYPGVRISQTLGVPDDLLGELVVTCIVPQDGVAIDEGALRGYLKERLASFKIPRRVLFFSSEEVALTASGVKVKSEELRKRVEERLASAG